MTIKQAIESKLRMAEDKYQAQKEILLYVEKLIDNTIYNNNKNSKPYDLSIIEELEEAVKFMLEPETLKKLNEPHKNPKIDKWLHIKYTSSFSELFRKIRLTGMHYIGNASESKHMEDAFKNNPEKVKEFIEFLNKAKEMDLFKIHRNTNRLFKFFEPKKTWAVEWLDTIQGGCSARMNQTLAK